MILLSLIVPVYNVEDYIEECLKSISNQLINGIEIIVVNDGTLDKSVELYQKHIADNGNGKYFKLINQENQGLSSARNTGVKHAKGDYIAFLDSDDILKDNYFLELFSIINNNKPDVIQFFAVKFSSSLNIGLIKFDHKPGLYTLDDGLRDTVFEQANWFAWLRVYKKGVFKQIDFPVGKNYEDAYTTPLLLMECKNIYFLNEKLLGYRVNDKGISATKSKKNIDDAQGAAIFLMKSSSKSNALGLAGLKMMHYCLYMSITSEEVANTYKRWLSIKKDCMSVKIDTGFSKYWILLYFGFYYVFIAFFLKRVLSY